MLRKELSAREALLYIKRHKNNNNGGLGVVIASFERRGHARG